VFFSKGGGKDIGTACRKQEGQTKSQLEDVAPLHLVRPGAASGQTCHSISDSAANMLI
jgi:hypothetical protein